MSTNDNVRNLTEHGSYRPDFGSLARRQVAVARESLNLAPGEFAEVLARVIGWTPAAEIIESWETTSTPPGDVVLAVGTLNDATPATAGRAPGQDPDLLSQLMADRFADIRAVYTSRAEFATAMPPEALLNGARDLSIAGLSLNIVCQQYADHRVRELVENGTTIRALFLDPEGEAIRARELEEGYHEPGKLSLLTTMNMEILQQRVYGQLSKDAQPRMHIGTYDETIRFNIMLINDDLCIAQPYLPATRGIDSPTFVVERRWATGGLFGLFREMFEHLWKRRAV